LSKLLIVPKKLVGRFTVTLPAVKPDAVSVEFVIITCSFVRYKISPLSTDVFGLLVLSGSKIVIKKFFSLNPINLWVP